MRSAKLKYTIPALLGTVLMITGLALGVYLLSDPKTLNKENAKASTSVDPKEVAITNISGDGFSVTWLTEELTTGYVVVAKNDAGQEQVFRDIRDSENKSTIKSNSHFVNLTNLKPSSSYDFYIYSQAIRFDNGGSTYQVMTAKDSDPGKQPLQISGKVVGANKEPAEHAIVSINTPGMSPQSVLADKVGVWKINLAQAKNTNLQSGAIISLDAQLTIKASSKPRENAVVMIGASQLSELPTMILGQSYDLTVDNGLSSLTTPQASKFRLAPELGAQGVANKTLTIWNPQENEILSTTRPLFIGTAPASSNIDLTLTQPQRDIKVSISADTRGNWQWSADENLSVGVPTLSAKLANTTTAAQAGFTISSTAIGSGPAIEASPSAILAQATVTPTKVPSNAPSATPTKVLSITPTKAATLTPTKAAAVSTTPTTKPEVSFTPTPTKASTTTITPTTKLEVSPTPTKIPTDLPVAGTTNVTWAVGLGVLMILGIGVLLVL